VNLLIATNKPERASYRQRIGIYLDLLRKSGIDCEVVAFRSGVFPRLRMLARSRRYTALFLLKKRLNPLDALWVRCCFKKIIYDLDDAVMYSDKTPAIESRSRRARFARTVRLADMVIAGNQYLAEHARKFNDSVYLLPTGLVVDDYRCNARRENDGKIRLVWIGSTATVKYLQAIKPALEQVGSMFGNITLRIICSTFFDLQNMPVERCVWSPQTQVADLVSCDIGLAPLPDDVFTRGKCGFKILQYQAARLPVVASPVGVNAEYVKDGLTGFHAQSTSRWVDRIAELVSNAALRRQMGEAAGADVQRFDVGVIGEKLTHLITQCLDNRAY